MTTTEPNIGERFRALRKELRLTQSGLGKLLRISRNYVNMIEGGRQPSQSLVDYLAEKEAELAGAVSPKRQAPDAIALRSLCSLAMAHINELPPCEWPDIYDGIAIAAAQADPHLARMAQQTASAMRESSACQMSFLSILSQEVDA